MIFAQHGPEQEPLAWMGWWGDESPEARAEIGAPWVDFKLVAHSDEEVGDGRLATEDDLRDLGFVRGTDGDLAIATAARAFITADNAYLVGLKEPAEPANWIALEEARDAAWEALRRAVGEPT